MALVMGNGSNAGESALLATLALACASWALGPQAREAALLPRVRVLYPLAGPLLGAIGLVAIDLLTGLPAIDAADEIAVFAAAAVIALAGAAWRWGRARREGPVRLAVIGPDRSARRLAASLLATEQRGYQVVGRISLEPEESNGHRPPLGTLTDLADVVDEHDVDLLLMSGEAPRLAVFDEMARSCLERRVRLAGMADFTEHVFGHVPIGSINTAWFQYILHPRFRVAAPVSKRVVDLTGAVLMGLVSLPLLAVVALLIRRDGGPCSSASSASASAARPSTMLKLRTMRMGVGQRDGVGLAGRPAHHPRRALPAAHASGRAAPAPARAARGDEPGGPASRAALLRRAARAPAALLRAPAPDQARADRLGAGALRLRRLRRGSAWKLCHDLFYVKHRSLALDLLILAETATQAIGRQPLPHWMERAPLPSRIREVEALPTAPAVAASTSTPPPRRPFERAPLLAAAAAGIGPAIPVPGELPWFPRISAPDAPFTPPVDGRGAGLEFEPIATLEELREPWAELAERSGNVFSSWEWADVWWRHFGAGRQLLLTACHDRDGRLVAILPLYLASTRPVRVVRFLGHGVADQLGPVCAPEDAESAALALRPALDLRAGRWDVLLADRLPGSDRWVTRGPGTVLRRESSPVLRLDHAGWDEYLATRSANFRQQLRRRERALARDHDLRYRLTESPAALDADLDTLYSLHSRRWAGAPVPTAFTGAALGFHRELAAVALERGWLRLWTMELDGRPAAAWYGFRFGGVESYYQAGRDPDREHGSIGLVLLAHSVRAALEDGMREYRFLRGGEDFKRRFTDSDPAVVTMALARTMAGRASVAAGAALAAPRGRAARRMVRRATSLAGIDRMADVLVLCYHAVSDRWPSPLAVARRARGPAERAAGPRLRGHDVPSRARPTRRRRAPWRSPSTTASARSSPTAGPSSTGWACPPPCSSPPRSSTAGGRWSGRASRSGWAAPMSRSWRA